jgi:hypothetical protein
VQINMAAQTILGSLALVFLLFGGLRSLRDGRIGPAARTWLMIGVIFGIVSVFLWLSGSR